jgi:prepilin-type N-terminal cleavage/methylation domain-containing protein
MTKCCTGLRMKRKSNQLNQKGFTLIELTAMMVIMGVMASVGVKKFNLLSNTATSRALQEGVKELNIRESLTWTNKKLSPAGWTDDAQLFSEMDTELGTYYVWTAGPDASGGTLTFRSESIALSRSASTKSTIGSWQ